MSTTSDAFLRKTIVNLQERLGFNMMLLDVTMSTVAAFSFDCGRLGLEGAGAAHIEALEHAGDATVEVAK